MSLTNDWFQRFKKSLIPREFASPEVSMDDEISRQIQPTAKAALLLLTVEELFDYAAKAAPDIRIDEETSITHFFEVLVSLYLNSVVHDRLGEHAKGYMVQVNFVPKNDYGVSEKSENSE